MRANVIVNRIGITGTPGTGKKTIGQELARLTRLEFVSLNEVAIKNKAGKRKKGEFVVSPTKLRGRIDTRGKIVCGHLLPYVVPARSIDFVAVLRCSPIVLRRRLKERGYSPSKIKENLEAELLDLIALKSLEVYGRNRVFEFDTTRTKTPRTVALKILQTLRGKRKRQFGLTKWSQISGRSRLSLAKYIGN